MKLHKYGLEIQLLKESDLEVLRYWRNHPSITQFMVYRSYITPKMQYEWFEKIKQNKDIYSIINYNKRPIGLVSITDINKITKSCEGGIFIWDNNHQNNYTPLLSSLYSLQHVFYDLKLNDTYATVLKTNQRALRYNQNLGYKIININNNYVRMVNTVNSFEQKSSKYLQIIKK